MKRLSSNVLQLVAVLAGVQRQPPGPAKDLALASVYAQMAAMYGANSMIHLTFMGLLVADHYEKLDSLGLKNVDARVQRLMEISQEAYQEQQDRDQIREQVDDMFKDAAAAYQEAKLDAGLVPSDAN